MNKIERAGMTFVRAVAAECFASAKDAKAAVDVFTPEKLDLLQELVESFLLSCLVEAEQEDDDEDDDDDDEDWDEDDDEDEDEEDDAPPARSRARKSSAAKRRK